MTYPTTQPLKIKIDGTDRTARVDVSTIEITETIGDRTSVVLASFEVLDGSSFGLAVLQEVIISNIAEDVRYFAGYIYTPQGFSRGSLLDYGVQCVSYAWDLEHPESLVDGVLASKSDQWIIQNEVATCIPDIDCTTHVEEVLADTVNMEFDQETPRSVLDKLAALAGAEWYVDFGPGPGGDKAYLHYFDASTNAAPFSLSDSPDLSASFPYSDLDESPIAPEANKVIVVGAGSVTSTRTKGAEGDYGRWLITVHKDRDISTEAQAEAAGDELLNRLVARTSYSCKVLEPGLHVGQEVTLVNAARSLNDAFEIKRLTTTFVGGGYAVFKVDMGDHVPDLAELVAKPHQGAPHNAPLKHEHAGGADGEILTVSGTTDSDGSHTHGFSGSVTGTSDSAGSHTHGFSASVSGASASEGAHTHSFSDSVTGTSDSESTHTHSFSDSSNTNASSDNLDVHQLEDWTEFRPYEAKTSTEEGHYHYVAFDVLDGVTLAHTHSVSVSGTTGAGSSHSHGAGTYGVSGTTGAGSSHSHGAGTFEVDDDTTSAGSHTHGAGGYEISGTTDSDGSHTHSFSGTT